MERDLGLLARFSVALGSRIEYAPPRLITADDGELREGGRRRLDEELERLRAKMTPLASKHVGALVRKGILPVVAGLIDGICAGCNVAVPTGVVGAILSGRGIHGCLRCKRILITGDQLEKLGRQAG